MLKKNTGYIYDIKVKTAFVCLSIQRTTPTRYDEYFQIYNNWHYMTAENPGNKGAWFS